MKANNFLDIFYIIINFCVNYVNFQCVLCATMLYILCHVPAAVSEWCIIPMCIVCVLAFSHQKIITTLALTIVLLVG